jgi:hypothetical protein
MKRQVAGLQPKLCKAGQQLRLQVDDSYPDRDKSSDGWIGDTRHQARASASDHNPDVNGIVRAIDIDRDLSGKAKPDLMPDLADQIRRFAKRDKSKRISYIIFAGRIASPRMGWRWRKYSGINPHDKHCHVSFTKKGDTNGSFFNIPMIGGTDDKAKR